MCRNNSYRHRRRRGRSHDVVVTLLVTLLAAPPLLQSTTVGASAKTPTSSVRPRPLMGIRRAISKRWKSECSEQVDAEGAGITLGDLDLMLQQQQNHHQQQGGDDQYRSNHGIYSTDGSRQAQEAVKSSTTSSHQVPPKIRSHLRRIHLDLSGRVMSHVLSPANYQHATRESVPLFTLPLHQSDQSAENNMNTLSSTTEEHKQRNNRTTWHRFIPHLYVGAYYDLDEVWYGATRWISKCSWGPINLSENNNSMSMAKATRRNDAQSMPSILTNQRHSINNLARIVFPSISKSSSASASWIVDMEGEQSVFDGTDSTCRIRLVQVQHHSTSLSDTDEATTVRPRHISLEYDSAKYFADTFNHPNTSKRKLQYAPTISMHIRTPFLHRRIELQSKKTWIIKEGGDKHGNFYGGDYYTSKSNAAGRRLNHIKEQYKDGIPKSTPLPSVHTAPANGHNSLLRKISHWLENDGWMPRRVTTNLMGNLVSVSEVELVDNNTLNMYRDEIRPGSSFIAVAGDGEAVHEGGNSKTRSLLDIIPPIHSAGVRLRVSKKINWTTLGIFPWSNSNAGAFQTHDSTNGGWREVLQSTNVRIELCGLYGIEKTKYASVGLEVDPLDWIGTYKFTIGQEGATILGKI
jgi:hypothetical protein